MIVAIVQARMSSRRLPGKVLMPLAGKPMLDWVLDAVGRANGIDRTVLATSADSSDDQVAAHADERGIDCHRGPLDDVAGRFMKVLDALDPTAFVRISADSPLIDPAIIDVVVNAYEPGSADVVTTVFPRTVPSGKSVELVASGAFRRAYPQMDEGQREHVTQFFYAHPDDWRIVGVDPEIGGIGTSLTVDTPEDAERIEAMLRDQADG
jgi:spore coat polysaccharide biosynthesis protein SpsF